MPQSLAQIYLHLVFSTKNRAPFLQNPELRQKAHAYLAGACRRLDSPTIVVGGYHDHVHILCRLSRKRSIAELVRELKRESSKWVKSQTAGSKAFRWQEGYGAFSISPSHVDSLRRYVSGQEEHHRTESFQDEFRRLLANYDVGYDERYVWD